MKRAVIIFAIALQMFGHSYVYAGELEIHGFGDYFSSNVKAKNGEQWLGLVRSSDSYSLIKGTVTHKRIEEGTDSEDTVRERMTFKVRGKSYAQGDEGAPIFLVRGGAFSEGALKSVPFLDGEQMMWLGIRTSFQSIKRQIPGQEEPRLELYATGSVEEGKSALDPVITKYCLRLGIPPKAQKLVCDERLAWEPATVVWAGDIDRDDKLDIVIDASGHESAGKYYLFLSSRAGTGEVVKLVSTFQWSSC